MASSTTTRRGLIGAAAGAGAGYAISGPVLGAFAGSREKLCLPSPPGVPTGPIAASPHRHTIWVTDTHSTTITARPGAGIRRGRSIDVGGAPNGIAISPNGRLALVSTAFYDRPGLALVDLRSGRVDRLEAGSEPGAVAFSRDGKDAYVAGGGTKGTLTRIGIRSGKIEKTIEIGEHPRGLALTRDGKHAVVALNGEGKVAIIDLERKGRVRRVKTPRFPHELAVSRDGRRALVTHNGFEDRTVSLIELREHRLESKTKVAAGPAGVAFSRSAARAIVATASGRAVVLDSHGRRLRTVKLGGTLGSVLVTGSAAYIADSRSGRLHKVALGAAR